MWVDLLTEISKAAKKGVRINMREEKEYFWISALQMDHEDR